ncbi:LLM class flavin-dependent oxidoreductase [Microbacterium excoecariae]|uniref:LLM class flavin-dependent oxidoreductase n=1 Tax=Microbacterium excoecariae TaxID=2715210 RepID=UPI00140AC1A1|nr:LLM class flavin-dependent oxidoreductase [Microbacterium excoecariae]NHI17537.1 LLM class flavin-dependent oxidoreductase [Microbacterium excoecariae]
MELGVFSLTDIYPGDGDTAASRTDDITSYGIAAERAGLDVFGIGEHHSRNFAVSSPAVNLAAIAQATSRIRLTTTATVLSVQDPVRVYQDFASLDLLSHGRAEIYAGRSAFAEPFALFGEDIDQLDSLYSEKLDLLLRLRAEDAVTWNGAHRPPLRAASANPPMRRELPVWVAVGGTLASAQRAGQLGLPMALGLIGGTLDHAKRLVDTYRAAGREAGHDDATLDVGITSHFYVGDSQEEALSDFFPYYRRYLSPDTNGGRGWHVDPAGTRSLAARRGALMVGGPREIAEKVLDLHAELGATRFLGQVDLGGLPRSMVHASIRRFGEIVAPAVRQVLGR